ncbi:MAG: pyridoxal phosphate-dependent aminotransferase, partial [Fidelibacterota bacterium]
RVCRLGLGQSPFPVPEPVVEALREHAHEKAYLPVEGLPGLREGVARFHQRKDQVEAHPECVIIGPGSKELMFLLQICFYGEIIIRTPCWVSYMPQAHIIGRKVKLVHTNFQERWRLSPERLVAHLEKDSDRYRPRLLVLNYPGNPEGCSYTADELREIAEIAKHFELVILSDEIYGELHHKGEHVSIARFYPEGTVISSGLSKWCGAGGWRLGSFAFPPNLAWLMKAMAAVASETYSSVSAPIQYAAVRAFDEGGEMDAYLGHVRRILSALGMRSARILSESGIRVHEPVGAFYLFLDFSPFAERLGERGITTSRELCERLLQEAGVAIIPGESFGQQPEELTARMAYVDFDGEQTLKASRGIPLGKGLSDDFVQTYCGETVAGVLAIVQWLSERTGRETASGTGKAAREPQKARP